MVASFGGPGHNRISTFDRRSWCTPHAPLALSSSTSIVVAPVPSLQILVKKAVKMGEIDTKPIESVQTALSFFGQQTNDHRRNSPIKDQEVQQERDIESLEKDLANIKVQLEAKESAYKQALLKIDHHQNTADELSILLINSDFQKDFHISECREANVRINELESATTQMAHKLFEFEKVQEQLSRVTSDLESMRSQLLNTEKELTIMREAKVEYLSQAEAMGNALSLEKLKMEELMRQLSEANEAILCLQVKALEVERGKTEALSEKEAELELARKAVAEAKGQLECKMNELETMHDLENQLVEKAAYISSLQLELNEANKLQISSEKAASDAISELNKLKDDMGSQEKKNSDQTAYINVLVTEIEQLKTELGKSNAEEHRLNEDMENMKSEFEKIKEIENGAQVEIALLNSELHKGRSKLAAAEAAEARAQSEKSALYNALQQMGLEAEETKKENRALKEAIKLADEETRKNEAISSDNFIKGEDESGKELENTKKELEIAMSRMGELRTRAEQAISRAEAAEKAKVVLEDQMKRRKEHKERRKAALAALREESIPRDYGSSNDIIKYDTISAKSYQPLGKVLNMKF
ncbi:hypothetical protein BUALT_Bualt07G0068100 [Buddleja alternifolia]|uniref:Uncharacterized protein n=1 Tax=Buddleja alternifolia TaxID=168488 RepID=A0AAV6X808_9LAMI|nr:hypothetical protein BUALT_Bualt07G0068100 [Buddleja alternifolia]